MNRVTSDPTGRLTAEQEEYRRRRDEINEAARANWNDRDWHLEAAQEISDTIYMGFRHENIVQYMATVENVDEFDRITVREVRGLHVFWVSLGSTIEESSLTADVVELQKDYCGFHVSELEDKMRANFVVGSEDITGLAIQAMDASVNKKWIALVQAAIPNASPYAVVGAGVSLAAVNTALEEVEDETLVDNPPAIIGRAPMVNAIINDIQNAGMFLPETNEQIMRTGVLGYYRGVPIIKLRNWRDDIKRPFVPGNELYVTAADASTFGFWGGLVSKQWIQEGGWYWHLMGRRAVGGMIHHPERIRRIVDTSRAA